MRDGNDGAEQREKRKEDDTHGELEGFDEPERLIYRAANWEIVDSCLPTEEVQSRQSESGTAYSPQHTLRVDQEQTTERDAFFFDEDAVRTRNGHGLVREQWELEVGAEAAVQAGLSRPGEMGEL